MLLETYLANVKKLQAKYPGAIFENITRTVNSELAPSVKLLINAGIFKKLDGTKNPKMPFKEYKQRYRKEILANPRAMKRLRFLKKLAKRKRVYFVCYELDPKNCHRTIALEMAAELEEEEGSDVSITIQGNEYFDPIYIREGGVIQFKITSPEALLEILKEYKKLKTKRSDNNGKI